MTYLVNNDFKEFKNSLNDLLSSKIARNLTDGQRDEIYKVVLNSFFKGFSPSDTLNDVEKLHHFDLMKETLIKIGRSLSEKFKQLNNIENNDLEIKLLQVLNDTIDHPITLPYLIPNLCECILLANEFLLSQFNINQKVIEMKVEENFNKTPNEKINDSKSIEEKVQNDSKICKEKFYKIYSTNKTCEYYESKKSKRIENGEESWNENEKKSLGEKIDAIASQSNKLHQLNQKYRRNKEEMQDELMTWKSKYHRLVHELEEKETVIEEKQNQFESLELELNAIKVQLESIYKKNQLLDSDKLNLSSNVSTLQQKITEIETQNNASKEECLNLKQIIDKREKQIECLREEFEKKISNLEEINVKKLIEEEQENKRKLEQAKKEEIEVKLKYKKLINEFESKNENLEKELSFLKQEMENLRIKLDEKVNENFKLTLELKEKNLRIENLIQDKNENEEIIKKCRDDKNSILQKKEQSDLELNKFKKLYQESCVLIESKKNENEQLQCDLSASRDGNVEISSKLLLLKNENIKQLELTKKKFANEIKEKNSLIDKLNESINHLKKNNIFVNEENNVFVDLFKQIEGILNTNQSLTGNFDDVLAIRCIESHQLEKYLDLIKKLKVEFKSKEQEINKLKDFNKIVEKEYEEQKNFLNIIKQKLDSISSQLKIKDCELIHLKDELAECKIQKNEFDIEKLNFIKTNENLKTEKSNLELLNIELKKQITYYQLHNVDLKNDEQINLNKIIELDKQINELNENYQKVVKELKYTKEQVIQSSNTNDQLERELNNIKQQGIEIKNLYENEKEQNINLNEIHQKFIDEQSRLEKELYQFKLDNQQLEVELNKIEKEFKDYEEKYEKIINDRILLIDLVTKYNIILKTHLSASLESNEKCFEFTSNSRINLKLIKPDCLMQVLLDNQNEQSNLRRQMESLKIRLNEQKIKVKEEANLNQHYKDIIEHNENTLLTKKMHNEKMLKEQRDLKIKLEKMLEENEKLKTEKNYLSEKVLNLDRMLESTKEFIEQTFAETNCDKMKNEQQWKYSSVSLEQYSNQFDQRNEMSLEEIEMRLIHMHERLTEFIDILVKNISEQKEKDDELDKTNKILNDKLDEMKNMLEKSRNNETALNLENENLKKELRVSNHNSKEIDNQVKQLTNQIINLQNECSTLQNLLETNRLKINDLTETNNRMKLRIKQLEATINLCEIKIKESERNLCEKSNQVIGKDSEIICLKSDQNHMQNELKKLKLQNKLMNNEINQTLIKTPTHLSSENCEKNLNKFITFDQRLTEPRRSLSISNLNMSKHQRLVKKINVFKK